MTEYRNRTTGEVRSQGEVRKANPNISLPKVWNSSACDALNVDPILAAPQPTEGIGQYQRVIRNGVVKDSKDNWVYAWSIVDMYANTTEDGVTTTKAQHEAAYQKRLDDAAASSNRATRNDLMLETDWWASSDLTMTSAQTTYRQALRDMPTHSNWPNLDDNDWPTKP